MPFDWENFISLADQLVNRSDADEAAYRSAISRAYYGVFGKIKIYVSATHKIKQSPGDAIHQKIIETLKQSEDSQEFSLGNSLSQLRASRNEADYDSHTNVTKVAAENSIKRSRNLMRTLAELKDR